MFETRKKLAKHFFKLGRKKHPYVLEMRKNKGDNPKTEKIEPEIEELKEVEEIQEVKK